MPIPLIRRCTIVSQVLVPPWTTLLFLLRQSVHFNLPALPVLLFPSSIGLSKVRLLLLE
jgi:hypothetical protein